MKALRLSALLLAASIVGSLALSAQPYPYQDPTLSPEERAADIVSRLTLEQKASLMVNQSAAIPEWGIKRYDWWSEALHGYARNGLATVYPQAIGMAASFDPALVQEVFTSVSDEARAKSHHAAEAGEGLQRYQGLTVWTPNINIFRDPRWGRGQETYGEDPFLTAEMGIAVVRGLQGPDDSKYDKLHACAKHYAVHSGPEYERHEFDAADISLRDLTETYLYAFERLVREANVQEVMCAYNAYEGEPCCASNSLLTQILRNQWGYDGLVVSDCGAISDFYNTGYPNHRTHADAASASADAVINGTDLNCGGSFYALVDAVRRGLIEEADVDRSLCRLFKARFMLGEMDPDSLVEWTQIPMSVVASDEHDAQALQIAREGIVLLKNGDRRPVLPLKASRYGAGRRLAVVGPNAADSVCLLGNYNAAPRHTVTVLEGIQGKIADGADAIYYNKVSEWVTPDVFVSRFDCCTSADGQGFHADYFQGTAYDGTPVATASYAAPFQLSTIGSETFAEGVGQKDFSAVYTTTFHAPATGTAEIRLFEDGKGMVKVNGEGRSWFNEGHGYRVKTIAFEVEEGKDYEVEVDFAYTMPDALLGIDLGMKVAKDDEQLLAELADIDDVVYVGGISPLLEGEEMKVDFEGFKGGDRTSIELPAVQRATLQALHAAGKRVIFVNLSGSAIAMAPEVESCDAIVQGWYGGQEGGRAIADVLFGDYNPAGRLPVTFHRSDSQLPDFRDYNMKSGHTYRYLKEKPLFAFGHGLSYSRFKYGKAATICSVTPTDDGIAAEVNLVVPVRNKSRRAGDEVVQVYVKNLADTEGPVYALRAFKRVHIAGRHKTHVVIKLTDKELRTYDHNAGGLVCNPGTYRLYYGPSSDPDRLKHVDIELK